MAAELRALAKKAEAEQNDNMDRLRQTRAAFLEKNQYPPGAMALAGKSDIIEPNHVEPWTMPLRRRRTPDDPVGKVMIRQHQDRTFVSAGETAVATFEAIDTQQPPGHPQVGSVKALLQPIDTKTNTLGPSLAPIEFHDDGQSPDTVANDSVYSALVPPSASATSGFVGPARLTVEIEAGGETGVLLFSFTFSAAAPAVFTGEVRDSIVDGSLVFDVGIKVLHAGRYEIRGRLFDGGGAPMALAEYKDDLAQSARTVRLTVYGKLLRDQNGKSPFVLKNLEGWRLLDGVYPDREVMTLLPGPFTTSRFDVNRLTTSTWDSAGKQSELKSLDDLIDAGGQSPVAPVDSNGIPLPPTPPAP